MLLDGRNRREAAKLAGIVPPVIVTLAIMAGTLSLTEAYELTQADVKKREEEEAPPRPCCIAT